MKPLINFIGAGNLGKTIARLIVNHDLGTIQGIANRTLKSSVEASKFISEGTPYTIGSLPPADITFVTTPDDDIQKCCEDLVLNSQLKKESIILHCSGSLSSQILTSAKKYNCHVASVHPMKSFANPTLNVSQYTGTYCAIEGDPEATLILHNFFRDIGSITYDIDGSKKGSYHAAGVFASNYIVALCHEAISCLEDATVNDEVAAKVILNLMRGTLDNLEANRSPIKSLTGPIKRGDAATIQKHLNSLHNPRVLSLYKQLGLSTLKIASLAQDKENEIKNLLTESNIT